MYLPALPSAGELSEGNVAKSVIHVEKIQLKQLAAAGVDFAGVGAQHPHQVRIVAQPLQHPPGSISHRDLVLPPACRMGGLGQAWAFVLLI